MHANILRRLTAIWAVVTFALLNVGFLAADDTAAAKKPVPMAKGGVSTKFIRVQRDEDEAPTKLETAIVSYVPASGKGELVVDLVGAVHVGDKAYYDELNKAFQKYDVVLYELVAPKGTVPKRGRRGADNPLAMLQTMTKKMLELESQTELIDYTKDNFVHADLSPQEMADAMKERGEDGLTLTLSIVADALRQANLAEQKAEREGKEDELDENPLALLFDPARSLKLKRMMAESFADPDQIDGGLGPTLQRMLVEDRNKAALKVFQKELTKGHKRIAIFYGAAHMPDFERRLAADFDLKPGETRWVTAWDMKSTKKGNAIDPIEALLKALQDSAR